MSESENISYRNLIISETIEWLEKAVIGLNLCPFAKSVYVRQQIRLIVSQAQDIGALLNDLNDELQYLSTIDANCVDTTLLIHPGLLHNFLEYNDFLDLADDLLEKNGLTGEIQIASFHPDYQFADSAPDAIENYTNRSPYPMLHLLREASIEKAVDAIPDAADIYEKNMATMRQLGLTGWHALFNRKQGEPDRSK
ncbi:MAG: hypothetical protein RL748_3439 [Pseudomonadota bacterium]|jgi:hypothetical protein